MWSGPVVLGKIKKIVVLASAMVGAASVANAADDGACFFNSAGFEGAAYCTAAGTRKGLVDHPFGKRFRSVQLTGSAVVHICEYSGFGGRCMVVETSQPDLDRLYVNNVESFEVLTGETSGARFFNHVGYADSGVHNASD